MPGAAWKGKKALHGIDGGERWFLNVRLAAWAAVQNGPFEKNRATLLREFRKVPAYLVRRAASASPLRFAVVRAPHST